jgi:SagB-type dehydrogenase family enzyme
VFAGTSVISGGRATFQLARGTATVEAPRRILSTLAARCDGETPFADVRRELLARWQTRRGRPLPFPRSSARARSSMPTAQYSRPGAAWENPQPNPVRARPGQGGRAKRARRMQHAPSFALRGLLEKRRSAPGFSAGRIALSKIRAVLWAAYGVQAGRVNGTAHRTVASGGALFPLRLHLINLRGAVGLPAGVYAVDFRGDGAVGLRRVDKDVRLVCRAFGEPGLLRNAQAVIVVSGEFGVTAAKYGNRSLLYVPLEAGHAAQNAMLAATDLGLAALEIGGFMEERIRRTLSAGAALTPLTTIAIGTPAAEPPPGPSIEFTWVDSDAPFHLGMARLEGAASEDDAGWGRDRDPLVAFDKGGGRGLGTQGLRDAGGFVSRTRRRAAGCTRSRAGNRLPSGAICAPELSLLAVLGPEAIRLEKRRGLRERQSGRGARGVRLLSRPAAAQTAACCLHLGNQLRRRGRGRP